jgi:hypothetical protein
MAQAEAEMAAHQKAMREALTKFYAALTPEQQKVFDALHRLRGPGGPGGHDMMMMHGPGPMGPGGPHMMMMRRHGPGPDGPGDDGPH